MNYEEYYQKASGVQIPDYYKRLSYAQSSGGQVQSRTIDSPAAIPGEAREVLALVDDAIKCSFQEDGSPMPPLLEGCIVAILGAETGRDAYVAAKLVGPCGKVIAVEPNTNKLETAKTHLDNQMKAFGYDNPNIEFVEGIPEDLSFIEDNSVDVVISNCTFNLSPDKGAYLREVKRVLKPEGEFYFTDVYTDRRIPKVVSDIIENVALRLGGATFIEDFRRMAQNAGFYDPRYVITFKTPLTSSEQQLFPDITFATITSRLISSELTSDHCEDYGEEIVYDGSLSDYPDFFLFDKDIKFPANQTRHVCDNVSVLGLGGSRYAKVIKVTGNRDVHYGDIHGDHIIKESQGI